MLATKLAGQWFLPDLCDDTFSDPLPELRLCSPELFSVAANHQRCFLPLLPLRFNKSQSLPPLLLRIKHTSTPERPTLGQ